MIEVPRLLVLASTYPRWAGDTEPGFVHGLSRRLTDRFEVHVLTPHAPGAATREELDGVKIHRYRYAPSRFETLVYGGGILTNLRLHPLKWLLVIPFITTQFIAVIASIYRIKPAVIHAHWLIPQGFLAALALFFYNGKCKLVITSHGADVQSLRSSPFIWIKRFTARRADKTITVSSALKKVLLQDTGLPEKSIDILSMGVDLQRFSPSISTPRRVNQLLFVGRFVEKKGIRHLIDSLPLVIRHQPDIELVLVGFGPDENALRKQVTSLGLDKQVKFTGAVSQADLPDLYRRSTLFVAPFVSSSNGDEEGLGLVLVEAAGCLCPIVCGNVDATREVIIDNKTGIVVNAKDHLALAAAILELLGNPALRESLADAARTHCEVRFDWDSIAKAYSKVLATQ
jgi:glycosyltransferase involved in cell wall biosynthesis